MFFVTYICQLPSNHCITKTTSNEPRTIQESEERQLLVTATKSGCPASFPTYPSTKKKNATHFSIAPAKLAHTHTWEKIGIFLGVCNPYA